MAELTRAKMDFVSIVTHQLRSPVTNLNYSLQVLTSDRMGEKERQEYFKILQENTERMEDLINDILAVSRLSIGTLNLSMKEFSIKKILEEVLKEFKTTMQSAHIKLTLNIDDNLPKMFSDAFWVKETIKNLIDNAIRYRKGDDGAVTITLKKKNNSIYFEIKDEGLGIPREAQRHIFEKFYRGKNVIKYQTEGTGLGLYIVQETIKQLGGKVNFSSQENKGAKFWFTLPIQYNNKN
jgi:two-component system phosphate regulon sensor histidine kinase PhoR